MAARVCHGALFRFPELNIAVIENGATWLPALLDILADVYKKAPEGLAQPTRYIEEIKDMPLEARS